jgi:uncharacterized membrane protein
MWLTFTRALAKSPSSIQVTTLNTAANMAVTGLMSLWLFRESLPLQWWIGAVFIVTGSLLMNQAEEAKSKKSSKKNQ